MKFEFTITIDAPFKVRRSHKKNGGDLWEVYYTEPGKRPFPAVAAERDIDEAEELMMLMNAAWVVEALQSTDKPLSEMADRGELGDLQMAMAVLS